MLSFVQDPIEENLMFAGTEYGLYVSFDGAKHGISGQKDILLYLHMIWLFIQENMTW